MFKAVLLGQWRSLSDPELERALITRLDFFLFCGFDELNIPDHSTLNRFRNWLMTDNTLEELISLINQQLSENNLKVKKAQAETFAKLVILNFSQKSEESYSLFYKDFSLSLRSRSKWRIVQSRGLQRFQAAIVDATIIQSAGGKLRKAIESKEDNEIADTPPSKDSQARSRWAENAMKMAFWWAQTSIFNIFLYWKIEKNRNEECCGFVFGFCKGFKQ